MFVVSYSTILCLLDFKSILFLFMYWLIERRLKYRLSNLASKGLSYLFGSFIGPLYWSATENLQYKIMELTVIGFLFIWTIESSLTLLVCTCNYIYAKFLRRWRVMTDEFNKMLHSKQSTSQTSFVMSDKKKHGRGIVQRRKAVCTSISQFLLSSLQHLRRINLRGIYLSYVKSFLWMHIFQTNFDLSVSPWHQSIPTLLHDSSNKTEMFNNCVLF